MDSLDGGFFANEDGHEVAVVGRLLGLDYDEVAGVDPFSGHRVTADAEDIGVGDVPDHIARHGDEIFDMLLREDGGTGSDLADEREHDHAVGGLEQRVDDFNRARGVGSLDVAFFVERVQVDGDAAEGADAEVVADLPD